METVWSWFLVGVITQQRSKHYWEVCILHSTPHGRGTIIERWLWEQEAHPVRRSLIPFQRLASNSDISHAIPLRPSKTNCCNKVYFSANFGCQNISVDSVYFFEIFSERLLKELLHGLVPSVFYLKYSSNFQFFRDKIYRTEYSLISHILFVHIPQYQN